jgi:hypothetical protein
MIFDNLGKLINQRDIWDNNLELVKKYIDKYNVRPSSSDSNSEIKKLGCWFTNQNKNYKNNQYNMLSEDIKNKWKEFIEDNKYKKYFITNEEEWKVKLKNVKAYIDKHGKRPKQSDKDVNVNILGNWISEQNTNYNKNKNIMKNVEIKNIWFEFMSDEKYKKYFMTNEEEWELKLKDVKTYIDKYNKKPVKVNNPQKNSVLGNWISEQQVNYKNKTNIMKNEIFVNKWKEFITDDKYKKYFITNEEYWCDNLLLVKEYIDKYNKRPSNSSLDIEIKKLAKWIQHQQENYKNKIGIMSNNIILNQWKEFIEDINYKKYFK